MGLIIGSLFWNTSPAAFQVKIGTHPAACFLSSPMAFHALFGAGLLFLSMMFLAFGGMAEVPIAAQTRSVVLKQYAARMYGIPAFVLSTAIVYIPLAIVDTFVFGSIVYW